MHDWHAMLTKRQTMKIRHIYEDDKIFCLKDSQSHVCILHGFIHE